MKFRYALGRSSCRPLNVRVNGIDETLEFPGTGSWSNWDYTESMRVYLDSGSNIIRASATGSSGGNIVSVILFLEDGMSNILKDIILIELN